MFRLNKVQKAKVRLLILLESQIEKVFIVDMANEILCNRQLERMTRADEVRADLGLDLRWDKWIKRIEANRDVFGVE